MNKFTAIFAGLWLLLSATFAAAESSYSISGFVLGDGAEPLPHATVTVEGTRLGTLTNDEGFFKISGLPLGTYRIRSHYVGYDPIVIGVDVTNPHSTNLTLHLRKNYVVFDQIVVTATRTERDYQDVATPTTVLTSKEIRESGAKDVAEAISDRLGIELSPGRTGGQSAEIMGADPKYALVLVDGEPLVGKFDDRTELDQISVDRIDRIEIVKGPGSSLYGSEAMSGVINIITKDPQKPFEFSSEAKTGDFDLASLSSMLSGRQKSWSYLFDGSSLHQGLTPLRDYITLYSKDRNDFGGKLKYFSDDENMKAEFDGGYTDDRETSKDPLTRYQTRVLRYDYRPSFTYRYRPWAEFSVNTRYSRYDRLYDVFVRSSGYHDESQSNDTREQLRSADLTYSRQFDSGYEANFGVSATSTDYSAERVAWGSMKKNFLWSAFAQSEKQWHEQLKTDLGIRFDRNESFGDFVSPKVAAMYTPNDWLKVRANVGRGFRAPSWIELYLTFPHPAVGYEAYGNPNLIAESSTGYNLGYEILMKQKLLWTVNGFYNDFRDQIQDYSVRPSILSYHNIGKSYTRGFESTWKWYVSSNLSASAGYQYMEAFDITDDIFLPHPRHSFNCRIETHTISNNLSFSVRGKVYQRYERLYIPETGVFTNDLSKITPEPIIDATLTVEGALVYHALKDFLVSAGTTNLLDVTNTIYGPYTGQRSFLSLGYNYSR